VSGPGDDRFPSEKREPEGLGSAGLGPVATENWA